MEDHSDDFAAAFDVGDLRPQADQRLDGVGRMRLGPRLEQLAQHHKRDDGSAGFKIHVLLMQPKQQHGGAEEIGRAGAERDQHVHVCRTAAQRLPGPGVEPPAGPELHRRRQCPLQPARQPFDVLGLQHAAHLGHQRQRQQSADHADPAVGEELGALLLAVDLALAITARLRGKAGVADCREDRLGRDGSGPVLHAGGFGGEVDRGVDARNGVERFLDSRRAGGATHAADGELERLLRHAETGALDRGDHRRRRCLGRVEPNGSPFGHQVHLRADPGQFAEHLLDPRRAGGATHTPDRQLEGFRSVVGRA